MRFLAAGTGFCILGLVFLLCPGVFLGTIACSMFDFVGPPFPSTIFSSGLLPRRVLPTSFVYPPRLRLIKSIWHHTSARSVASSKLVLLTFFFSRHLPVDLRSIQPFYTRLWSHWVGFFYPPRHSLARRFFTFYGTLTAISIVESSVRFTGLQTLSKQSCIDNCITDRVGRLRSRTGWPVREPLTAVSCPFALLSYGRVGMLNVFYILSSSVLMLDAPVWLPKREQGALTTGLLWFVYDSWRS